MRELDENIPLEPESDKDSVNEVPEQAHENELEEGGTSSMEDEKQIEREVLQTEQEDKIEDEEKEREEATWDGSESEFVEDDDAEEYEEKYAGIKFGYVLKKDEILDCLKHTGLFKSNGTRSAVEICLLLVLTLMFSVLFFVTGNKINFILGVISTVLVFPVVLMPRFFVGFNADKLTTGKKLSVEIYPDEIAVDSEASTWKIPLDGSCVFEEFNGMFLIYLPQEKLFIIPTRAIEPDFLADVQGMIIAGTKPKEES